MISGFLGMPIREHRGQSVLVVCHSIIVLSFRLLLERVTEQRLLEIDQDKEQEPRKAPRNARSRSSGGAFAPAWSLIVITVSGR